jgi:hypothetical protein
MSNKPNTENNKADQVPEGVAQALLKLVWGKPWTPYAIAVCVVAIVLFAVWTSLPDETKQAWLSRKPAQSGAEEPSPRAKLEELNSKLAQIDSELKHLDGTDVILQAVHDLKTKYPKGFDIPFSPTTYAEGEKLLTESVALLQRLKAYELSPDEQEHAETAEAESKSFFGDPAVVYKHVLQLAESLNTKADKLRREREAINADKARVLDAT